MNDTGRLEEQPVLSLGPVKGGLEHGLLVAQLMLLGVQYMMTMLLVEQSSLDSYLFPSCTAGAARKYCMSQKSHIDHLFVISSSSHFDFQGYCSKMKHT